MRKIQSSLRREVEGYQRSGHSLESAVATIRQLGRPGIAPLLDAMYGETQNPADRAAV